MSSAPLYYLIGASGAGKDSVLGYLREHLPVQRRLLFAHRYITRPAAAGGENHVALSPAEFRLRRDAGLFCLCWDSHGLSYGLGIELQDWLRRGFAVVVNGSREYLEQASQRFPSLVPVLIRVRPDILRQRLVARGRETPAQIEARLERAQSYVVNHPRLIVIDNDGPLDQAGSELLARIEADLREPLPQLER